MTRWRLAAGAALLLGCAGRDAQRPSLDGLYPCGPHTCTSGQICVTESAGSQCQVNADAGIGPYDTYSWMCEALPAACDGIPSCSCAGGLGLCLAAGNREVDYGCI
jgi:hypothetical protein